MNQSDNYKKFLMNRVTITQPLCEFIENCMVTENEIAKHSYHKIMIHNWDESSSQLFEVLSSYFGVVFVPVNYTTQNVLTTFYTHSLTFLLKIIKFDFMFAHNRNMFNVDILFNVLTSRELFGEKITLEDIVSQVVSLRFNEHCELNLSYFCDDEEFVNKKINFYKLSLLSNFKILMIRMGRDTKILNLSHNNLSQVPLEILNFFIKGELIGVNLSNNNIPSVSELHRISSKIEKLWVEENPLCEDMEPMTYIRQISQKFPRLTELDGIKLNEHGLMVPFHKNYLSSPDTKTKMIIEKFVSLYFAFYDSTRPKIDMFYDQYANLTLNNTFSEADEDTMKKYVMHSRNMLNPAAIQSNFKYKRLYKSRSAIVGVLKQLPQSIHDTSTFTIDVLRHDNKLLILVIDGVYKEKYENRPDNFLHFRRTFVFTIYTVNIMSFYTIINEMFSVSFATPEIIANSFKNPIRHLNQLTLINPDKEERDVMCAAFMHFTQLKKSAAEAYLLCHNWDIRVALKEFTIDLKSGKIDGDKLMLDEEMSGISSLLDDEMD